jgi:hypothetical protein
MNYRSDEDIDIATGTSEIRDGNAANNQTISVNLDFDEPSISLLPNTLRSLAVANF